MRGYHANKRKEDGWENGVIRSWYFTLEDKYEMEMYTAVRQPIYMREFPTAWRMIDLGFLDDNTESLDLFNHAVSKDIVQSQVGKVGGDKEFLEGSKLAFSNSIEGVRMVNKGNQDFISISTDLGMNTKDSLSDLSCSKYGGPQDEFSEEMVYWSDIPSDSKYKSPFYDEDKYLTFEPDFGGFNNIRMAMETVLVMAHAMGRTLVLPPKQKMYLLDKSNKRGENQFGFEDFFHMNSIHGEHAGLNIISMEEFLERKLFGRPPGDRTNWDGQPGKQLWDFLRSVGHIDNEWNPEQCVAAFPASSDPSDVNELYSMFIDMDLRIDPLSFTGKPVPLNGPTVNRLRESLGNRGKLCIYDEKKQAAPLIHFMVDDQGKGRVLTHFYAFVFFQDWKQDLWTKRFVRDHVRYTDEITCAASRVVKAIRERSRVNGNNGQYDALHIRRGDFQYQETRLSAEDLYKNSKDELEEKFTVYIATDERDKSFFEPLAAHYKVLFLDDFKDELNGLNTNYYGMVDQLISSRGRLFFGTWFSTFSGYINRMRGYHANKRKEDGWENGVTKSWYFTPQNKYEMQLFMSVREPIWCREFPTAWRNIDLCNNCLDFKFD